MGTEVSAAEQTAEVVIEEIKEAENVVKGAEEISSQFKDLEGKEVEEKVKEDLGIAETSSTKAEKTPENEKGDGVVKDVKKEEDLEASNTEILASATDGKGESIEQESDTRAVEPAIEVHEKKLNEQIDVANIPEPPTEEIGKSTEDPEEPSVKVAESEVAEEPGVSAVSEEENSKELEVAEDPAISAVSEEENLKESEVAEEPATLAVSEEENPKESEAAEEPAISAVSEEETPKVSEAVEEPAISEAVSEEDKLPEVEKPTEETTVVFSVSETEGKSEPTIGPTDTEPNTNTITTPDASETAETSQVDAISTEENEVRPESSKEEPRLTDLSNEEISDKLPEVAVSENSDPVPAEALPSNELTEVGDGTLTSQEVSDVSEKKDTDQHSSGFVEESVTEENVSAVTDSSPVTEIVEGLTKQEDKVDEEMQEKIAAVGEPTLGGATQADDVMEVSQVASEGSGGVEKVNEKMDETPGPVVETSGSLDAATEVSQVEGEKTSGGVEVAEGKNDSVEVDSTTLAQTSRDLDVEEGKDKGTTVDFEDSEGKKEETEKAADRNTVELSAKDGGDNTEGATAKAPQRQSNSIFSKVKQSIVKVKKAIIGKSPNSKSTTPPEGNDDIKVK